VELKIVLRSVKLAHQVFYYSNKEFGVFAFIDGTDPLAREKSDHQNCLLIGEQADKIVDETTGRFRWPAFAIRRANWYKPVRIGLNILANWFTLLISTLTCEMQLTGYINIYEGMEIMI
jgi:hypothetical protein